MRRLAETWRATRNRLVANPQFQKLAASTPLVRSIARRKARDVFDLCSGFVYSQVLLACVRLGVFEKLQSGPEHLQDLAVDLQLPITSARRLLDAAAAIGLVDKLGDDRYGLGMRGAAILANPGIARMVEHNALLYMDLTDPVAFLREPERETALSRYWAYASADDPLALSEADVAAYSTLMSQSQPLVADEILDAYSLQAHHTLLDVGGGEGRFLTSAGRRYPNLRLAIFDLPAVAARAKTALSDAGLDGRAVCHSGNFMRDSLPNGADVISLVRILHDHDDENAAVLLRNIHAALPDDGTLLIAEPLADTSGAEPMGDAYFGFYLMAMRSGRPRTFDEIRTMLQRAGFKQAHLQPTRQPLQTSLIVARR